MTSKPGYKWNLRQIMAANGLWKTSELSPLLEERGAVLSAAQVYRLVANEPERLSLKTLAALCDIFACSPSDLIEITAGEEAKKKAAKPAESRPRRARVVNT
jgi:DNA-binding Xre family transcriptional regulator